MSDPLVFSEQAVKNNPILLIARIV